MIVAVDTGGTKTLITSFNENGEASEFIMYPTPHNFDEYVTVLKEKLAKNYSDDTVDAIVIALPGIVENGTAKWCANLKWKNVNLKNELYGILNSAPIFIENDAKIGGLAAAKQINPDPKSLFYVTIGTGIGTAMINAGKLDMAFSKSEGGHMLIEYDGVVQEWEKFASGKAVFQTYGKYAKDINDPKVWYQIAKRISRGLLAAIPLLQPEYISIGGSIGTYFDKYSPALEEILKKNLPEHIDLPKIVKTDNPEEAVVYGCYYYALDTLRNQ
jgi:predicted NBD/HSP70 family sugar kinase